MVAGYTSDEKEVTLYPNHPIIPRLQYESSPIHLISEDDDVPDKQEFKQQIFWKGRFNWLSCQNIFYLVRYYQLFDQFSDIRLIKTVFECASSLILQLKEVVHGWLQAYETFGNHLICFQFYV